MKLGVLIRVKVNGLEIRRVDGANTGTRFGGRVGGSASLSNRTNSRAVRYVRTNGRFEKVDNLAGSMPVIFLTVSRLCRMTKAKANTAAAASDMRVAVSSRECLARVVM